MSNNLLNMIPGLDHEEMQFLKSITRDLTQEELETFASLYNGKRKSSETILIGGILGLFAVAGIQRFMVNQIGMGILYLLTAGLCFIGTIVDLVNHKRMTLEYNQKMGYESIQMVRAMHS